MGTRLDTIREKVKEINVILAELQRESQNEGSRFDALEHAQDSINGDFEKAMELVREKFSA